MREENKAPVRRTYEEPRSGRRSGPAVTGELRKICDLPMEAALRRAVPFLEDLVDDPAFVEAEILPALYESEGTQGWYVARRYEDEAYSLQVFVWPAGTGTRIHDHSSWGVYRCVVGSLLEERYGRLDDGSRPDHARLRKSWQLRWSPDDGASTVLPGDGGIHSMTNVGDETAVSVHLYGPRTGEVDGRDYDPSRDYVCDRTEDRKRDGERPTRAEEVREMRESCYCGRTGEISDRDPVVLDDGTTGLACPDCGHTDRLEWLPEDARRTVLEEAKRGRTEAA